MSNVTFNNHPKQEVIIGLQNRIAELYGYSRQVQRALTVGNPKIVRPEAPVVAAAPANRVPAVAVAATQQFDQRLNALRAVEQAHQAPQLEAPQYPDTVSQTEQLVQPVVLDAGTATLLTEADYRLIEAQRELRRAYDPAGQPKQGPTPLYTKTQTSGGTGQEPLRPVDPEEAARLFDLKTRVDAAFETDKVPIGEVTIYDATAA
jgi:hypothetical protein